MKIVYVDPQILDKIAKDHSINETEHIDICDLWGIKDLKVKEIAKLAGCSDKDAIALESFYTFGIKQEEIALIIKCKQANVSKRLTMARNKIKTYLLSLKS